MARLDSDMHDAAVVACWNGPWPSRCDERQVPTELAARAELAQVLAARPAGRGRGPPRPVRGDPVRRRGLARTARAGRAGPCGGRRGPRRRQPRRRRPGARRRRVHRVRAALAEGRRPGDLGTGWLDRGDRREARPSGWSQAAASSTRPWVPPTGGAERLSHRDRERPRNFHGPSTRVGHAGSQATRERGTAMRAAAKDASQDRAVRRGRRRRPLRRRHGGHRARARRSAGAAGRPRPSFPATPSPPISSFPIRWTCSTELGAGDRLRAHHQLRPVRYSWRVLGHAVAGGFTPVGGHDRTCSIRRVTLDAALVETAAAAGRNSGSEQQVSRPDRVRHRG